MNRPCRYCVAAVECELAHRDELRVYDLAQALAQACQGMNPTDEQVSWFLADADDVVDDFEPTPEKWRVRKLPENASDGEQGIEIRLRINDVTYVGLEGGKDCRGAILPLATFREQQREADR